MGGFPSHMTELGEDRQKPTAYPGPPDASATINGGRVLCAVSEGTVRRVLPERIPHLRQQGARGILDNGYVFQPATSWDSDTRHQLRPRFDKSSALAVAGAGSPESTADIPASGLDRPAEGDAVDASTAFRPRRTPAPTGHDSDSEVPSYSAPRPVLPLAVAAPLSGRSGMPCPHPASAYYPYVTGVGAAHQGKVMVVLSSGAAAAQRHHGSESHFLA